MDKKCSAVFFLQICHGDSGFFKQKIAALVALFKTLDDPADVQHRIELLDAAEAIHFGSGHTALRGIFRDVKLLLQIDHLFYVALRCAFGTAWV